MKGLTWRVVTVTISIVFAIYLLLPSVVNFSTGKAIPRNVPDGSPWYYHVLPSQILKLGLDLKGGSHLVLGIDAYDAKQNSLSSLKKSIVSLATGTGEYKISNLKADVTNDNTIELSYPAGSSATVTKLIEHIGALEFLTQTDTKATVRMTVLYDNFSQSETLDQALESIRRRIDEFGVSEPIITKQGEDKILVQFPGEQNPQRLKDIIARTAKLTFQIARSGPDVPGSSPSVADLEKLVADFKKEKQIKDDPTKPISQYSRELNTWLGNKIPAGTEIVFHRQTNINTNEQVYVPYLLEKEPIVAGDQLDDANYQRNEKQEPIVNFQLKAEGAAQFDKGTAANVGKHMAIVLDNLVHSAPVIKERIGGGRANITFGGALKTDQQNFEEARDTSLVLRSGALPARLEFLEERIIGPSLGLDAIRQGSYSLTGGLLAVFIFMLIYYRGSGAIAVTALLLNGLFIFSILAAFEGTLTLPGLAGVTLTLGMAVDANVLIFEHMREELRSGRSVATAIGEGYSRAFTAILDGNLTTIIAGVILLQFGYGPIRGFAVTLLIGLIVSMYTAVFVTRVIYDYFVVSKGRKTLSL